MEHRILVKLNTYDSDWTDRYSTLSASGKALLLAVWEARENPVAEVTSDRLAHSLNRRWTFSQKAIAAMAELVDADCIAVVRRGTTGRDVRKYAA
jgi:hypothetical protein